MPEAYNGLRLFTFEENMSKPINPPGEDFTIRCPRLGHQIFFSYCVVENYGEPCFKIIDCWYRHFDVETYLKEHLSPEQWDKLVNRPPKPKVLSLLELIEQAKKRKKEAE